MNPLKNREKMIEVQELSLVYLCFSNLTLTSLMVVVLQTASSFILNQTENREP